MVIRLAGTLHPMRALHVLACVAVAVMVSGCTSEYVEEYKPSATRQKFNVKAWPELDDASIRPGVNINVATSDAGGSCTSNFLFRSPDNGTLYLGLAAHCLEGVPVGTRVDVGEHAGGGKVAFNAWDYVGEGDRFDYDFALVALMDSVRGSVHPAVMHYGGPTAMADSSSILPGAKVITYGRSIQRPPGDPDNPREGWVVKNGGGDLLTTTNQIAVYTDHPGIQGDSGSGLMTADGQALGVLSLGTANPAEGQVENRDAPAVNWYVALDKALSVVEVNSGPNIELVTWKQLLGPQLPV